MEANGNTKKRGWAGVLTLLGSTLSNQTGAAVASFGFPLIGPVGVVAVRQFVAAALLLPIVRPRLRSFTRHQWWPVLLLALVFATMNLSLYSAVERIGLGLAVTLEFLGPLAVALFSTRNLGTTIAALFAGAGVVIITWPEPSTDYLGIGLALVAACSWASYILLNRSIGHRIPGIEGTAAATGVSAMLFVPVGIIVFLNNPPSFFAIACAAFAGVMASAVPYVAYLIALRHISAHVFGLLMSVNPVFAAVIGMLMLGQGFGATEWLGTVLIVCANVSVLLLGGPDKDDPAPAQASTGIHIQA
jgi:inner membrane transporter RhtA